MKKNTFLASLLGAIAIGQIHAVSSSPHNGFSVGIKVGYTGINGTLNRNNAGNNDSSDLGAQSPVASVFFGYGYAPNPAGLYLGAEVFAQFENVKAKRNEFLTDVPNPISGTTTLKTNNTFGLLGKVGYVCKETLINLILGVSTTKFNYQSNLFPLSSPINLSSNKRRTGFVTGIGMDYAIARNVSVGGEFLYTFYQQLKAVDSTNEFEHSYKPRASTFNIRLKYTF